MRTRTTLIVCLTSLILVGPMLVARANDPTVALDIPAQSLGAALRQFAEQTGLQLVYETELAAGLRCPPVQGQLTTREALQKLLDGTGLQFQFLSERTVALSPRLFNKTSITAPRAASQRLAFLAQEEPRASPPSTDAAPRAGSNQSSENPTLGDALEEIVVTGSHIRGTTSAGSKLVLLDRNYIEKSGYATVQDVLKTMPQNFGGGISEDWTSTGSPNFGNFTGGTSVNLRGLGADSTLLLVNGRRQPRGGMDGLAVDVSSIASTAVERVEVLADGASAIYGADAVGGVVNVILRRDYDGFETRARMGTLGGDADEIRVSQLFGKSWAAGHVLAGYQYYERERLPRTDRSYSADTDQTRSGGSNFSPTTSSPGNILNPSTFLPAFAIPSGQDGRSLTTGELLPGQINFHNDAVGKDLLAQQRMHSAFVSTSHAFSERWRFFADGRFATRDMSQRIGGDFRTLTVPSSNPFFIDPFGGRSSIPVAYNFINDFGPITGTGNTTTSAGTLGVDLDLGTDWQLSLAGTYGEERTRWDGTNEVDSAALATALADPNPATAFNPFGDGGDNNPATLNAIRRVQQERAVSDIWNANVTVDGPLFTLPGGYARLALGADYREEGLFAGSLLRVPTDLGREVSAAFAEFALPIVGSNNRRPGLERLELSLAGRYENYSDFGETVNPKAGITWSPLSSLTFRATWGTSFKAPLLIHLPVIPLRVNADQLVSIVDPLSQAPNGRSPVIFRFGNNPNLKEETADIWTTGLDFAPASVPGLQLSLTYYDIAYTDRVVSPGPTPRSSILLVEDQWADVITRNPSPADVAAICNGSLFLNPPTACTTTPPVAILDLRLRNLSSIEVHGIDFDVRHAADTRYGSFSSGLTGSYVLSFERAVTSMSPQIDLVDTVNNPLSLRLRASLSWSLGGWDASLVGNYADNYEHSVTPPTRRIDPWTTLDVHVGYQLGTAGGWLDNTRLALSAINVLDEDPPFANVDRGYDPSNADPLGRAVSVEFVKAW